MFKRLVGRLRAIGGVFDADDRAFLLVWGIRLVGGALAIEWLAATAGLAVRVFRGAAGW